MYLPMLGITSLLLLKRKNVLLGSTSLLVVKHDASWYIVRSTSLLSERMWCKEIHPLLGTYFLCLMEITSLLAVKHNVSYSSNSSIPKKLKLTNSNYWKDMSQKLTANKILSSITEHKMAWNTLRYYYHYLKTM